MYSNIPYALPGLKPENGEGAAPYGLGGNGVDASVAVLSYKVDFSRN